MLCTIIGIMIICKGGDQLKNMPAKTPISPHFSEDFSFKYKVTYGPEQHEYHTHKQFDIIFMLTPNSVFHVSEKNWKVPKNSIILFNNMDLHKITLNTHERFERYTLSFKPEYIESLSSKETDLLECFFLRPFSNPYILPLTIPQAEECLTQLKRLITCNDDTAKQDYGYDLKVKFLLGEFLIFINNLYRKYHNISSDTITSSYSLIYSVINHIHTHLSDELSLELLSSTFYINKFYLCNLFKNVTGTSPNQYIISCRIMKAKELLSQNLPVDSVCSLVGYKNLSHFSRIFKQHTGLSPKQYSKFKQAEDFKRK